MTLFYACGNCTKTCRTLEGLQSHCNVKAHIGLGSVFFKCVRCGSKFKSREALAMHIRDKGILHSTSKAASKQAAEHVCQVCKRSFKSAQGLADHTKSPGPSHRRFACKSCSRLFRTQAGLSTHMEVLHLSKKAMGQVATNLFCHSCERSFKTLQGFSDHTLTHQKIACKSCGCFFSTEKRLSTHVKECHPPTNTTFNYTCPHPGCERSFSSAKGLADHTESPGRSHVKKIECKACKSIFATQQNLSAHMKNCQGVLPVTVAAGKHVCQLCKRSFKTSPGLVTHFSVKHTGAYLAQQNIAKRPRDMKCTFCDDMFKSPSGIALHIESGVHKFHRHHVTAAVQSMGIVPQITIKHFTEAPVAPTILSYVATAASFNGKSYACFICSNTFKTLAALNSHLNSAAHDDNEFKCPKCETEFSLISGLVQHLESHCCGLAPLIKIDDFFNKLEAQFSHMIASRFIDI